MLIQTLFPVMRLDMLKNDEVVAVGKAVLSGDEMKKAVKGVAVRIRHRLK